MPSFAIITWRTIAVALMVLAPAGGLAVQAQPASVIAQAGDDDDAVPPRRRGVVPDEAEAPNEAGERAPLPRQGASRRLDPFDADDAPARSTQAPPTNPGSDVVVCEAGCDGPRGVVVYKQKK